MGNTNTEHSNGIKELGLVSPGRRTLIDTGLSSIKLHQQQVCERSDALQTGGNCAKS